MRSCRTAMSAAWVVLCAATAFSAPDTITYQGSVLQPTGAAIADGTYPMRFALYAVAGGGTSVWEETETTVTVKGGLFSVNLGDGAAFGTLFATQPNLWIEVAIDLNRAGGFQTNEVYSPRQKLAAAAWAMDADCLDSRHASDFALAAHAHAGMGDITGVSAGTGLLGGGASGAVTLSADTNYVQRRVTGVAPAGQFIRAINADGTVTTAIDQTGGVSGGWALTGNAGTTSGTSFLGTTDNKPLDLRVNNQSALRISPHATSPNLVGGSSYNWIGSSAYGATISGGGQNVVPNRILGIYGTIGGGYGHQVSGQHGTIGGGMNNTAGGAHATIGGGAGNSAGGQYASISGGEENTASGSRSVVSGGVLNTASGSGATVGGGELNTANGGNAVIGGGMTNTAGGPLATVGGGNTNTAAGDSSTVGGGGFNTASVQYATVGGGRDNRSTDFYCTIAGGYSNRASNDYATIGGGYANTGGGQYTSVGGGTSNNAGSDYATVGGGWSNTASGWISAVGGGRQNTAGNQYAAVGGGFGNSAGGQYASIAGGRSNNAGGQNATVGGGWLNTASAGYATVGGGQDNYSTDSHCTIAGGYNNRAGNDYATIGGGSGNAAHGQYATIAGGRDNIASGNYSFAGGWRARADATGSFVWADSSNRQFSSLNYNSFNVRSSGGIWLYTNYLATVGAYLNSGSGTWSSFSDRNAKENFVAVSGEDVLEKVAALPISTWNYKSEDPSIRHMGPMAQDLHAAFGLGDSDKSIATIDGNGIALAAVQALYQTHLQEKAAIASLEAEKQAQQKKIAELEARLASVEEALMK